MRGEGTPPREARHAHEIAYQRYLYDLIMAQGQALGIVDFGYRALDSMRLEKAYRLWGVDMSADYSPLEAGMERFVSSFCGPRTL